MAVLNIGAGWAKVLRHSAFEAWAVRKSLEILSEKRNTHPLSTHMKWVLENLSPHNHTAAIKNFERAALFVTSFLPHWPPIAPAERRNW